MASIDINRTTTISLPGSVSSEILQKTQETKMHQKRFQCEKCFYLCAMEEKLKYILPNMVKQSIKVKFKKKK